MFNIVNPWNLTRDKSHKEKVKDSWEAEWVLDL